MTATHVDGAEVVADRAATSSLTDRSGAPVKFRQIRELLLDNGQVVYGCLHCDYASPNVHSVRPHLNRHRDEPRLEPNQPDTAAAEPEPRQPDTADEQAPTAPEPRANGRTWPSIDRLVRSVAETNADRKTLTDARDYWQRRCLHAEALLDRLGEALTEAETTPPTPHLKGA